MTASPTAPVGVGSITLTQNMIDAFADVTGDRQWIHVDTERAGRSGFGSTIAHGMLVASLVPRLVGELVDAHPAVTAFDRDSGGSTAVINLGFARLDFASPVPSGTAVSGELVRIDTDRRPDRLDVRADFTVWARLSRRRIAAAGTWKLRYTRGA